MARPIEMMVRVAWDGTRIASPGDATAPGRTRSSVLSMGGRSGRVVGAATLHPGDPATKACLIPTLTGISGVLDQPPGINVDSTSEYGRHSTSSSPG